MTTTKKDYRYYEKITEQSLSFFSKMFKIKFEISYYDGYTQYISEVIQNDRYLLIERNDGIGEEPNPADLDRLVICLIEHKSLDLIECLPM